MDPLNLVSERATKTEVSLCDERSQEGFISVTLTSTGEDDSWGEFLTCEQAFAMWAWLYGILYGEPRWSDADFAERIKGRTDQITVHVPEEMTEAFIREARGE